MGGVLSGPWRSFPESYQENLQFLKSYKPRNAKAKHLRILLHGPIGAGKSSFINSVDSVFQNRMTGRALPDAISGTSFTKIYKTYKIHKEPGSVYSFVFSDVMGLENASDSGISVEDLKLVLKGHVEDGFKFKPEHGITNADPGYKSSPTLQDRVHVLVSVFPADTLSIIDDRVIRKMRDVRLAASELGVPQLVILTKIDEASKTTKEDIKNAYKCKDLEKQVNQLTQKVGIPPNYIFLVQNYQSEIHPNPDTSALILHALRQMVTMGEDFLNDQE